MRSMSEMYKVSKKKKKIKNVLFFVLLVICLIWYSYWMGFFDSFISFDNQDEVVNNVYTVEVNSQGEYRAELKSVVKQLFPKGVKISNQIKFQVLHDFVKEYLSYNYDTSVSNADANDVKISFRTRKGVCGAYAYIYEDLCELAGLRCDSILGEASFLNRAYQKHAWNAVYLDGKWYHVDVCWDDTGADEYEFFLRGNNYMDTNRSANRTWSSNCSFVYSGVSRSEIKNDIVVNVIVK